MCSDNEVAYQFRDSPLGHYQVRDLTNPVIGTYEFSKLVRQHNLGFLSCIIKGCSSQLTILSDLALPWLLSGGWLQPLVYYTTIASSPGSTQLFNVAREKRESLGDKVTWLYVINFERGRRRRNRGPVLYRKVVKQTLSIIFFARS